jgi:hypothetical protein
MSAQNGARVWSHDPKPAGFLSPFARNRLPANRGRSGGAPHCPPYGVGRRDQF